MTKEQMSISAKSDMKKRNSIGNITNTAFREGWNLYFFLSSEEKWHKVSTPEMFSYIEAAIIIMTHISGAISFILRCKIEWMG